MIGMETDCRRTSNVVIDVCLACVECGLCLCAVGDGVCARGAGCAVPVRVAWGDVGDAVCPVLGV